jgi:hypothetical protein
MTATIAPLGAQYESRSTDLFRTGDEGCSHSFTPWETISGVSERDGTTVGELYFESNCRYCPARVGRAVELTVL